MIPVRFRGESGIFVHSMYLDDEAPIAGGREIWGVPQKLARPKLCHESEVLVGTLHFGSVLCAMGSMGYKHQELDQAPILRELGEPSFLIKIIPHVDGKAPICELVRYRWRDVVLQGAWGGPAALQLLPMQRKMFRNFQFWRCFPVRISSLMRRSAFARSCMIIWWRAKRCQFTAFPSRRSPRNERNASAARKGTPGQHRGDRAALRPCRAGAARRRRTWRLLRVKPSSN
jgi:hypothetical protein